MPLRSNIPAISRFTFSRIDETYYERAIQHQQQGSFVVAGHNYGQGSSREHAVLAPRYLGLKAVIAKSFARIHWQNLINFGILPLTFADSDDWAQIQLGDQLALEVIRESLAQGDPIVLVNRTHQAQYRVEHALSPRQVAIVLAGGLINWVRR